MGFATGTPTTAWAGRAGATVAVATVAGAGPAAFTVRDADDDREPEARPSQQKHDMFVCVGGVDEDCNLNNKKRRRGKTGNGKKDAGGQRVEVQGRTRRTEDRRVAT
jgi:hypothetical protein